LTFPADGAFFDGGNNHALRHVVQVDRLPTPSSQNVASQGRTLRFPEIEQNLAQFLRDGDKPFALLCLCAAYNPMPHPAPDGNVLLNAIPLFPAQASRLAWPDTGKSDDSNGCALERLSLERCKDGL